MKSEDKKARAARRFLMMRLAIEKEARFIPQVYGTIAEFFAEWDLIPGKHGHWRLTEVHTGQIQGLPKSRGFLVATDGILAYIITQDGSLYKGHWQHFVKDPLEHFGIESVAQHARPQDSAKPKRVKRDLAMY